MIDREIMRIRQSHSIRDRIKLIVYLLFVLTVLGTFAKLVSTPQTATKTATIEKMLMTAMKPVGDTMYIWGGGWDGEDQESGATSTQIGLSKKWAEFAQMQDESYDFNQYRFEREKGLDCSGYVGWVLYNTFEKESGLTGYVTTSTDMAESFAERGWGKLIKNPRDFLPGDIVSMEGHVWISLGTCKDGSVLLVHSSPPGVSVCGTKGMAIRLATEYMRHYHPNWQGKYSNREVSLSYLKKVTLFRWNKQLMTDAECFQCKSAEEIIGILSNDMVQ